MAIPLRGKRLLTGWRREAIRAPFLRAEMEWARPWREGKPPVADPALSAWAVRFDPVWVARVSRPPLGVCCDHLRFHDAGP
ncbi:MAG: hypothetical protein K2W96_12035 [Gemmataceae bacterium]|nr:hypothetical protein [Gemmataceae bacterium]